MWVGGAGGEKPWPMDTEVGCACTTLRCIVKVIQVGVICLQLFHLDKNELILVRLGHQIAVMAGAG